MKGDSFVAQSSDSIDAREDFTRISGAQHFKFLLKKSIPPTTCSVIGHHPDDRLNTARSAVAAVSTTFHETMWAHDQEIGTHWTGVLAQDRLHRRKPAQARNSRSLEDRPTIEERSET